MVEVGQPLRVGGKLDSVTRTIVGDCDNWRVWYVGEKQRRIIEEFIAHVRRGEGPRNRLLYSAEGAGKTVLMGMLGWLAIFLATESGTPGCLGATAPTHSRLGTLVRSICDLGPVNASRDTSPFAWGTYYVDAGDIVTRSGHVIQARSTKRQSQAVGSPIQGWTWSLGALMDEIQDSIDSYEDVVARLRGGVRPPIVGTATAKDSPTWRDWRDSLSTNWQVERIRYTDTPFVHDQHWALMQAECSPREWKRRGLALDVGPERQVYVTWERDQNLRPVPLIGAKDVTSKVLARCGMNLEMLVGHDPGQLQDVSVMLKAFEVRGEKGIQWYVVDELTTPQSTTEQHAVALKERLQQRWGIQWPASDEPKALIRCDPYGDSDSRTDRSVYTIFKQAGFTILSAAYKKGKGNGRVPKEAGIELVCSLLCNATGDRRLFVSTDESGKPAAPRLVEAFETAERDAAGNAETQRKGASDLSHWPAALRYALWSAERVRDVVTNPEGMVIA